MNARARGAALLAAGVAYAGAARAEGVGLTLADCPGLDDSALREHLQLELVTLKLEHAEARLLVRCAQGSANIELEGAEGTYPIQARVELRDTARAARERLVALAATELLAQAERARETRRAARSEAPAAAPPSEPARPSDADTTAQPSARPQRPVELFVAGSIARAGAPKTALWGGSIGTLIGFGRRWSLLLDTRFERGAVQVPLADVRWSVLSGFVGPAARLDAGPARLTVGLGLRAGWLALDTKAQAPHDGLSLTAPWAGVALPLRLSTELSGRVVPFVGLEAGYVFLPVRGTLDTGPVLVEQRGLWLAGNAGVGVTL